MNKESLRKNIVRQWRRKHSHLLSTVQSMNFYTSTKSYLQLDIISRRTTPTSLLFLKPCRYLSRFICIPARDSETKTQISEGGGWLGGEGGNSRIFEKLLPIAILMRPRGCMSRIRKYKFVKCNGTRKHFHTNAVI